MRSWAYFVNSESLISTREWGYVMWDRSRLDGMGIFEDDWVEREAEPPSEDIIRRREQRLASTQRRGEIYWAGGRGWWSFNDESKVVWPNRREPNGQPTKEPLKPKSLGHAKEIILSLIRCPKMPKI
jgi:hypothetical protein